MKIYWCPCFDDYLFTHDDITFLKLHKESFALITGFRDLENDLEFICESL